MIKLCAYEPSDGYAFIKINEVYYSVRSPFNNDIQVSEKIVANAVIKFGFQASDKNFDNRESLIHFLKSEMISFSKYRI